MNDSSTSSWATGLAFSITASLIGACSKLCIRKSYTLLLEKPPPPPSSSTGKIRILNIGDDDDDDDGDNVIDVEMKASTTTTNNGKSTLKYSDTLETEETSYVVDDDIISETDDSSDDSDVFNDDDEQQQQQELIHKNLSSSSHQIENKQQPPWFRKLQAFGLRSIGMCGMMFLGPICNVYALQFASPSILSPVGGGLTLVWVILLSECTIGEKPRQIQITAVQFIVLGEICVAFAGDHSNEYSLSQEELHEQYIDDPAMIVYLCVMALWMILLTIVIRFVPNQDWKRFAWGVIGGSITGVQCAIKDALALLHGLDDYQTSWPASLYILLIFGAAIPFIGLILLMACMKRYDATYTASMFMGSIVISSSIMSAVHYHTFDHISAIWQSILYLLGLLSMLFGTAIIATEARWTAKNNSNSNNNNNNNNNKSEQTRSQDEATTNKRNLLLHTDTTKFASNSSCYGTVELGE